MLDWVIEIVPLGDPPVDIRLGKMTLDVRRKLAKDVVREPILSHIGNVKFDGKLDVPEGTCVVSQVGISSLTYLLTYIFGDRK